MADIYQTLLLLAFPASGKSEVRTYLTAKNPEQFHMGPTVQLDDYPYVHLQLLVDEALLQLNQPRVFHHPDPEGQRNGPFMDPAELGGLIYLLNDDYKELQQGHAEQPENPGMRLLERFDSASERAGGKVKFRDMDQQVKEQVAAAINKEAASFFQEKAKNCPKSLNGKTVVVEFARGGPYVESGPVAEGYGYQGTLKHLSRELIKDAAVLYIWVDPEESRRKNRARARPDGHGSILFHGTPESVMTQEYGTCDMAYLIESSAKPDTVHVDCKHGAYDLPVARFDNRTDLTTFLRKPQEEWTQAEIDAIHGGLKEACDRLWKSYQVR